MKYHRPSKKQVQIEKDEPFTKRELRTYDKRERNFIRGIQIKDDLSKKHAKMVYKDYLIGNIKNRKKFRNEVNTAIQNTYPKSRYVPKGVVKQQVQKELPLEKAKPKRKRIKKLKKKGVKKVMIQGKRYTKIVPINAYQEYPTGGEY